MMSGVLLVFIAFLTLQFYPIGLEPMIYRPGATLAAAAAAVAAGWLAGRWAARALVADDPFDPRGLVRHARRLAAGRGLLLGQHLALTYLGHGPALIHDALGFPMAALDKVAALLPFIASLAAWWAGQFPAEQALRGSVLRMGSHLRFQLKGVAAFALVPMLCMSIFQEASFRIAPIRLMMETYPFAAWIGAILVSAALFAFAPEILRLLWRARPIPPGPVRRRLEACCARAGIRCRDFLVWNTAGTRTVNAFVAGILPRFRYVFFTDAMLERLHADDVEAVLAHELGHAACRHLPLFLFYSLGFFGLTLMLFDGPFAGEDAMIQTGAKMLLLAGYWGLLFGRLSRRFETEADLYGARLVGDPLRMAGALQRVVMLNGASPTRESWRHPSPAQRVGFLAAVARFPALELMFRLRLRRLRALLALGVAGCLAGAGHAGARQLGTAAERREQCGRRDRAYEEANEALAALARKKWTPDRAARRLREANALEPGDPQLLAALGEALEETGEFREARRVYAEALRGERDIRRRIELARKLESLPR